MTDIPKTEAQLEAGLEVEKKETETSQSPELPPNVYRINTHKLTNVDAEQCPGMLKSIMKEYEFTDCLKRIKEAHYPEIHSGAIIAIPFILFVVFILIPVLTKIYYLFVLLVIDIIAFFVIFFTVARKNLAIINGKTKKLEETLKEINSTFYSRGVKWSYSIVQAKEGTISEYIEIITFAPGADDAPRKDDVMYASQGLSFPGVQPSGEPLCTYPAPPPEDTYGETTPYTAASSSSTLNEVYKKEVADNDVDGPNPYESYPGDPSNLY